MIPDFTNQLHEGDLLTVADDVAVGDVVFFERSSPSTVVASLMTEDRLLTYSGCIYVLADLSQSGSARFQEVSRDDLEASY